MNFSSLMNLLLEPTDSFSYSNTFLVLPKSGSPKLQYLRPLIMLFVLWILTLIQFSSIQFSHSVLSDSLRPHGLQHTRPPCPSPTPRVYLNSCSLSRWCLQPSHPLSSPSPPAFNLSQHQDLFKWVSSSHLVAQVLKFQLQHQSFQWIFRTDFL